MSHYYELPLFPTPAQAQRLEQLAQAYGRLRALAAQEGVSAEMEGFRLPAGHWTVRAGLPRATVEHVLAGVRQRAADGEVTPVSGPGTPALTGPGLMQSLAPGYLVIAGVPGSVRAGTDDPARLPRWAREVLGEASSLRPTGTLVQQVPGLRSAAWVDWVDIRREFHGWVVELQFSWPADRPVDLVRAARYAGGRGAAAADGVSLGHDHAPGGSLSTGRGMTRLLCLTEEEPASTIIAEQHLLAAGGEGPFIHGV